MLQRACDCLGFEQVSAVFHANEQTFRHIHREP